MPYRNRGGRNPYKEENRKGGKSFSHGKKTVPATQCLGMDCEMVGIGHRKASVLARVSIVDLDGNKVLDTLVRVGEKGMDCRTRVSGIQQQELESRAAMSYGECRTLVKNLIFGKILVGHALQNDLDALKIRHPVELIRDTSQYAPFMTQMRDGYLRPRRLSELMWEFFGKAIQNQQHCSLEDARSAMSLYRLVKDEWERSIRFHSSRHARSFPQQQFQGQKNVKVQNKDKRNDF
jgi:RNA exonuclease 4